MNILELALNAGVFARIASQLSSVELMQLSKVCSAFKNIVEAYVGHNRRAFGTYK